MPARHPPELAREREEAILGAARRVLAVKGYEATRIQDVADVMGIAKGTIYLYFRSKEELYWAALRAGLAELHLRSEQAMARESDVEAKLRTFVSTRLQYFDEHRDFFRVYFGSMGHALIQHGPAVPQIEDVYLAQVRILRALVEEGIASGALRGLDPQSTAFSILELVRSRVTLRLRGWSTLSVEDELDDLFGLLWKGIAA